MIFNVPNDLNNASNELIIFLQNDEIFMNNVYYELNKNKVKFNAYYDDLKTLLKNNFELINKVYINVKNEDHFPRTTDIDTKDFWKRIVNKKCLPRAIILEIALRVSILNNKNIEDNFESSISDLKNNIFEINFNKKDNIKELYDEFNHILNFLKDNNIDYLFDIIKYSKYLYEDDKEYLLKNKDSIDVEIYNNTKKIIEESENIFNEFLNNINIKQINIENNNNIIYIYKNIFKNKGVCLLRTNIGIINIIVGINNNTNKNNILEDSYKFMHAIYNNFDVYTFNISEGKLYKI